MMMMLELQPVLTLHLHGNCEEDSPLSMSDCESLENICDYEEVYNHKSIVEEFEVLTIDKQKLPKIKPGNKSKPITKIFKDKSFSPSLEDIKEVEDKSKEDVFTDSPYFLSLKHVHYDRAFTRGVLKQDSGRSFRNEYWKTFHQRRRKSPKRRTVSI